MHTDAILNASRAVSNATPWPDFPDPGPKNRENLALLIGLIESGLIIAQAIYDNAMDDRNPIDSRLANQLYASSCNIARLTVQSSQVRESMPRI